jgi:hypothetical protein
MARLKKAMFAAQNNTLAGGSLQRKANQAFRSRAYSFIPQRGLRAVPPAVRALAAGTAGGPS